MASLNPDNDNHPPIKVRNPRTGEYDYHFTPPDNDQLASVCQSLRSKQADWEQAGIENRIAVIQRWQQALLAEKDNIISALAIDTGRQLLAEEEFNGLLRSIDRWCGIAPSLCEGWKVPSAVFPNIEIQGDTMAYPLVGAISPWNFPLLLSFIDVTPALLAGCAAIIKPSEVTPRFAEPVAKSIAAVPELNAILRIIPGDGLTGQQLIEQVDVVAFTGSVATGKKVAAAAAQRFIPAFLELGGKDAVIVLEGTDIDRATTAILRASVAATGQACQSLERIYVARKDHDEFVEQLTAKAKLTKLSRDDSKQGIVGPVIFNKQADIITEHLADAIEKGAQIHCGGHIDNCDNAFWIEPTVLSQVDHSMKIMSEETFGPVMPVMSFDDPEQAIVLANDSSFGLSGAVFGPDESTALEVARRLKAGGISVNDAGMTTMIFETEKSAFGFSGMGPSRVGSSGLTRFFRKKSLYVNRGEVMPVSILDEKQATVNKP